MFFIWRPDNERPNFRSQQQVVFCGFTNADNFQTKVSDFQVVL